ncbi:2,3-bisphosphoglycerate-dependent phosphoglycerate mutase [Candidatus Saccharibacteria bacterium]|nr:2,3-bisphosphoglycerate-dependent phosphoglycerate mutase [Candidatus Saccharibacteria bacterium]
MAQIDFFETTPQDRFELEQAFKETDHRVYFHEATLGKNNINPEAEVISVFIGSRLTADVLAKMPGLKLIATRSTGFDHIDMEYASRNDITVVNVPTYGEATVAEHAFALLLSLARRVVQAQTAAKTGNIVMNELTGFDIESRTLGVIGAGKIGRHVARIAKGFGMRVLAYDAAHDEKMASELGFSYVSLEELLQESDVISLHVPSLPETYHLINHASIERMKTGVIIINTGRGDLIETSALIDGLRGGKIAAAGLDTVEGETFLHTPALLEAIRDNAVAPSTFVAAAELAALKQLPQVIITPHVAFNTREALERINHTTARNIIDFWYGSVPNKVALQAKTGKLVLLRHGESEWNVLGKWTGTTDVHITNNGRDNSVKLGQKLGDISFDFAYTSEQIRTRETLEAVKSGMKQIEVPYEQSYALNERDYGVYTGMQKDEIKKLIGNDAYNELRRSWDGIIEDGESLKQVYDRVVPYYLRVILPRLRHGQNVIVVAHGNSLRSLIKYIENISHRDIGDLDMLHDTAVVYSIAQDGRATAREERSLY